MGVGPPCNRCERVSRSAFDGHRPVHPAGQDVGRRLNRRRSPEPHAAVRGPAGSVSGRLRGDIFAAGRALFFSPDHRSIALGFVDQTFSSATNFGLSVIAGRLLGPAGLGVVFMAFTIYIVALGLQRRLLSEPLLAGTAGAGSEALRETSALALTVAILFALTATSGALVAGLLLPGFPGRAALLIAPWFLPTLLQDVIRNILFRDRRPVAATVNDAVWFAVMAIAEPLAWHLKTAEGTIACWGLGALGAATVGIIQLGNRPRLPRASIRWWRKEAMPFGKWNASAGIVSQIGSNAVVFVLSGIVGVASLGGLRGAESVFAPLTIVIPAISLPGLPLLARAVRSDPQRGVRISIRLSLVALTVTSLYAIAMVSGGWRLLPLLFGPSFARYRDLIWPIAVAQLFTSAGVGLLLLMKAEQRGKDLLVNGAIAALVSLVLVSITAWRYGLIGAAWGTAAGAMVYLGLLGRAILWRNVPR
jgi:O-antigen/teichoic acid export membrane protein